MSVEQEAKKYTNKIINYQKKLGKKKTDEKCQRNAYVLLSQLRNIVSRRYTPFDPKNIKIKTISLKGENNDFPDGKLMTEHCIVMVGNSIFDPSYESNRLNKKSIYFSPLEMKEKLNLESGFISTNDNSRIKEYNFEYCLSRFDKFQKDADYLNEGGYWDDSYCEDMIKNIS